MRLVCEMRAGKAVVALEEWAEMGINGWFWEFHCRYVEKEDYRLKAAGWFARWRCQWFLVFKWLRNQVFE